MADRTQTGKAVRKPTKVKPTKKAETITGVRTKPLSKAPTKRLAGGKAGKSTGNSGKLVNFRLEAPQAREVFVAGCFNGWDPMMTPLERNREGVWTCALGVTPGEYQYRFVVDGEWCDDPLNSKRCWNEFGTENSVLIIEA
jgi:1,4-alpha-glucan branching enzyme